MNKFLLILGTALIGYGIGFISGRDITKSNTKVRALEVGHKKQLSDTIYTQGEVEYIVFGESQL